MKGRTPVLVRATRVRLASPRQSTHRRLSDLGWTHRSNSDATPSAMPSVGGLGVSSKSTLASWKYVLKIIEDRENSANAKRAGDFFAPVWRFQDVTWIKLMSPRGSQAMHPNLELPLFLLRNSWQRVANGGRDNSISDVIVLAVEVLRGVVRCQGRKYCRYTVYSIL